MNRHLCLSGMLALASCATTDAPTAGVAPLPVPAAGDVTRFVPADMTLHSSHPADLDRDGDEDLLLVLAARGPAAGRSPRGVMVLVRAADGAFRVVSRNDAAIPCATCGGMMGDPLAAVSASEGGFELRFEGGSRELWSSVFHFEYDPGASTWVLANVERRMLDRATGESRTKRADASVFGRVTFDRFDPGDEGIAPLD